MSELISGKDALMALANGEEVVYLDTRDSFVGLGWGDAYGLSVNLFFQDRFKFRLKPRTITLNGVELSHCASIGICRIKNEVSIQFKDESDAGKLHDLLAELFGFRG